MTKVLATGIVSNLSFSSVDGKDYKLANLDVGGKSFTKIFKRPQGLADGVMVEVVEHPAGNGRKYPEKEIRLAQSAAPAASSVNPSQPARTGYTKDPAEQDRIMRQWAVTQAICFINLAREAGAVKKTVLGNEVLLFQLTAQYANLLFNGVQTGAGFEKLPQFTGHVNEASETTEETVQ